MIEIKDDFLPYSIFKKLQNYCLVNEFKIVEVGNKKFSILETPENIKEYLNKDGYDIILTFIRSAWNDFDNEIRIHCDWNIMEQKTSLASILYINDDFECSKNGTAFYNHHLHGKELSECSKEEEYNRLILEDSNNEFKWKKTKYVNSKPNRLLTYSSNLFHSKYPKQIKKGVRKVCVVFYVKK
jgi:Family of unknown function (DUF6445)